MKHANISLFVPHAGCPHQCSFCNQKTISGSVVPLTAEQTVKTLAEAANAGLEPRNTEIAFFGGSFTAIERDYMVSLLEAAYPFVENGTFCGIRVSTRPDAVSAEILEILKKYGVTSVELGAQSTDDAVLNMNNRGHSRADIFNAAELIKQAGISLGLQMMTGLYGDTPEKCVKTAGDIIRMRPDTVRIYPTITLEGTYLAELYRAGTYNPQTLDEAVELCAVLLKMFHDEDITVIRLGLHSGGNVDDGYVAGPYHPAFGELCDSKIYLEEAKKLLVEKYGERHTDVCSLSKTPAPVIYVNDREISKMIGQKRSNLTALMRMGYDVTVKGNKNLSKYEINLA